MVKLLIEGGAEIDWDSKRLETAIAHNKKNYFTIWRDNVHPGSTPIGQTILGAEECKYVTLSTLKTLLHFGADPNRHTYSGYTPLQLAIVKDRREHAELLLAAGADPSLASTDFDAPNAYDFAKGHDWAEHLLRNSERSQL